MRKSLSIICCLCGVLLALCVGCQSAPPIILSENVQLPPYSDFLFELSRDVKSRLGIKRGYSYYFGVKPKDYAYIYEGVKMVRVTLMSLGSYYIFEIQTLGDIELAKRKYGYRMQFKINILGTNLDIFTTATMEKALLVSGGGHIEVTVNEKDELLSARFPSNFKVKARLRLEIDRDRMRIYVPKKALPERTDEWWPRDKLSFHWLASSNLAKPPLEPLETNLPEIFHIPMVYDINFANSVYREFIWATKTKKSDKSQQEKPNKRVEESHQNRMKEK